MTTQSDGLDRQEAKRCHAIYKTARRLGELKPEPCLICGDTKVHAHHPNYSHPLSVIWLCNRHHRLIHGKGAKGKAFRAEYANRLPLPEAEIARKEYVRRKDIHPEDVVVIKEYRCEQYTAFSRLLVSLPPVWVGQNGIGKGDTLLFCQVSGSSDLIIRKASNGVGPTTGDRP